MHLDGLDQTVSLFLVMFSHVLVPFLWNLFEAIWKIAALSAWTWDFAHMLPSDDGVHAQYVCLLPPLSITFRAYLSIYRYA